MSLEKLQQIANNFVESQSSFPTKEMVSPTDNLHPFDERSIHPEISKFSQQLFDDGHYAQATFEAYKFLEEYVKETSSSEGSGASGVKLMADAFNPNNPKIHLADIMDDSGKDEQKGYMFLFQGATMGIRNPRGHSTKIKDDVEQCLDHLSLASLLLRKIDARITS